MITLLDAKQHRGIQRVAGFCPDSADFVAIVNEGCSRLLKRGDWAGTVEPMYLCVRAGCVVWPRYVQTVRAMAWCGFTIQARNMWGDYLPRGNHCEWRAGLHWHQGAACSSYLTQQGRSSVFQDIQGDSRTVRAYARCNKDYGKTITIFGIDTNNQPLQHQDPVSGDWLPGQILTLQNPFASTTSFVRHIDYVLLEAMQCPVNLFAYNSVANVLEDLAQYDPGETRPSFQRTKVTMPWGGSTCTTGTSPCCPTSRGITALAKLRFIPAKYDTDLLIPDNLDALKLEIQSIKFGEQGDRANRMAFEADAIADLNRQLEDESPDDQFVADNNVFGGYTFSNHMF